MMWAVSTRVLVLAGLVASPVVHRSPADDLLKVQAAFTSATSWHADEHMPNGSTITVDYSAPDRWRIQPNPKITEMIIGSDVYMVNNGRSMKVPMPGASMQSMLQNVRFAVQDEVKQTAKDLGMQTVNGQSLHAYSYTANGNPITLYVGGDDLPAQSVVNDKKGTVTIVYSQYNAPITIQP